MPKPSWGGAGAGAASGALAGSSFGPIGTGIGGLIGGLSGLFSGQKKPKIKQQSTLRPEQERLYEQLQNALINPGAGGAFGDVADYYRNLMSDNPADYQAFAAPALRQYNEEIVPGLSEQFAGMGSGGLSSSGFRNAQIQGATDLSERLGSLRAQLRQQGVQGLQNLGAFGLSPFSENVRNTPQANFSENLAEGVGQILPSVATSYFNKNTGGIPKIGGIPKTGGNKVGMNTSPYGNQPTASPKLPDFSYRR